MSDTFDDAWLQAHQSKMAGLKKPSPLTVLRAPVVSEGDLHESVAKMLDIMLLPPAQWTTFPAGSVPLPPQFAAKLMRMGLKRGWPDILVLHGGIFGIELKRVGGKLSKSRTVRTRSGGSRIVEGQADTFPKLQNAGMTLAICDSVDAVLDALVGWGIPVRRTSTTTTQNRIAS